MTISISPRLISADVQSTVRLSMNRSPRSAIIPRVPVIFESVMVMFELEDTIPSLDSLK